jgi:hypothetical protein
MAISKLNPIEGGIPKGNTNNRSVEFPSPATGDVYYNGELEILEIYNGTTWVAVSAPPATPTIGTPIDVGNVAYESGGTLTIVFTPGSGGGTPNQYNVSTTTGGFSSFNSTSPVTITGLTPATAFSVYGNAQNNFGTTVNTANSAAVTATTLPQVPTIGTATASTSANEVTVTWTNGSTGGKNLSAITITPFLNGTTAQTSRAAATTSSTSYTFTEGQLTAGSAYTFKVKATNANGTCADSNASNSAIMPNLFFVDYLIIAGGGGGGKHSNAGGGGGAGGYRTSYSTTGGGGVAESVLPVSPETNYTVTIGAGGAAGTQGGNSVFSTITSTGGGFGGGSTTAGDGGSSGGGNGVGLAGTRTSNPVQGYNGASRNNGGWSGNGGGGAGGAGFESTGTDTSAAGGNGGAGLASSITGTSVLRAGGGGGMDWAGSSIGYGGNGFGAGGGNGAPGNGNGAGNGDTNTGGGGGGAGGSTSGGLGGSGVVIIRYPSGKTITIGAGLTGTTSTDGSYKVTTITAGTGNVSWV